MLGVLLSVVFQLAHCVEETDFPELPADAERLSCPWAVHQVQTTADFAPRNRLLTWYVGGLNFQIEHHLFPRMCHVHYPKVAAIVQASAPSWASGTRRTRPSVRRSLPTGGGSAAWEARPR